MGIHGEYFTERGREKREMYLLLILLISPAFGRPSSDQDAVGNIENHLNDMLLFSNEKGKILLNPSLTEEVVRVLLEAEQSILKMNAKLKTFETKAIQFNDTYFPKFNQAKSYLRQSRRDLRKLAERTITDVRDMKIFLGALDETKDSSNVNLALKIFLKRMKDLMIETLETLKEAKGNYNSALETFDNLKQQVEGENRKLNKMLDKDSEEYKAWKEKVVLASKGQLGVVVSEVSELFCSNKIEEYINNWICFPVNVIVADAEAAVARSAAELKKISDKMLESGYNFEQAINVAIAVLQNEIEIIGRWTQSAKTVSDNIEEYSVEVLRLLKPLRTIFVTGLDNLKKAAEDFLAQPKYILTLEN